MVLSDVTATGKRSAMSSTITVRSDIARKAPDPLYEGITHWTMWVRASDLPTGIPAPNNSRVPKDDLRSQRAYRSMSEELVDTHEPQIFHLKNKGITLTAHSIREVKSRGEESMYRVILGDEDGIIDGGHTYKAISESVLDGKFSDDNEQFVKLNFILGMDTDWIPDVSEGQNSTVQVQDVSILNQRHAFDWLKDLLEDQTYFKHISWQENLTGAQTVLVTDIIRYLYVVHPEFDNPTLAYANSTKVLEHYKNNIEKYQQLAPVVDSVLRLTDFMSYTARKLWVSNTKRWFTANSFVGEKYRAKDSFWFIGKLPERDSAGNRPVLHAGAVFAFLYAFRPLLESVDGEYVWAKRLKTRGNPREVWTLLGYELMDELAERAGTGDSAVPVTKLGKDRAVYTAALKTMRLAMSEKRV